MSDGKIGFIFLGDFLYDQKPYSTGAGKSSIMTALFRIVELTSGSMVIDGVDLSKIGLTDVRSGLAIIPQDAVSC